MRWDDQRKIGSLLMAVGFLFFGLGIVLFLDAALLSLGNVLFLTGLTFTIGVQRTIKFFTRIERWRGIACFFVGLFFIAVWQWTILGLLCQSFGFLNLFGSFFPVAIAFLRQMPILGPILNLPLLSSVVDRLAGVSKQGYQV